VTCKLLLVQRYHDILFFNRAPFGCVVLPLLPLFTVASDRRKKKGSRSSKGSSDTTIHGYTVIRQNSLICKVTIQIRSTIQNSLHD
jgi:hypothetical protein